MSDNIAIIGAGNVGGALGRRLAHAGYRVHFGVRAPAAIAELVAACEGARATSPAEAAQAADAIFLTVPAAVAVEIATSLGGLAGKLVVDCSNPLRWEAGPVWNPPP